MIHCSYHASHEQFAPSQLLQLASQAEAAGFDGVFCSDHLQPWAPAQGHSGHAWVWLGAAMQCTRRIPFSTITVPGGWRYHPVPLAQAIGTLGQMFPDRLPWIAFGSGEALNEHAVGAGWPSKAERNERLREGVELVRALLQGRQVTHAGHLRAEGARLWDLPATPPRLFGAATSEATARWLGSWADGLLTLGRDLGQLERIIQAFREGGGTGKPVHVKLDVAFGDSDASALQQAHQHWRFNTLGSAANASFRQPEDFAAAARSIRLEDLHAHVLVSSDPGRHLAHLHACGGLGVESIDIHHVGVEQERFIEAFGRHVLPALRP